MIFSYIGHASNTQPAKACGSKIKILSEEFLNKADVTVKQPRCAQDLLLLSIATPEPIGSYAQMGWYDVWSPYKP